MITLNSSEMFADLVGRVLADYQQDVTLAGVLEKYYNAKMEWVDISKHEITFQDPRQETLFRLRYAEYI